MTASVPPSPLLMADLQAAERTLGSTPNGGLTEAKEAVIDGLLALTVQHCTGDGPTGAVIFAAKPSAKLVSGFLLPRFDHTGQDDDTSDIRLATMGMDLQLDAEVRGHITITPQLSIYVRVLPSWGDITDPRHDMMPQVKLAPEVRREIEERARTIINEQLARLPALPEVTDSDADERDGNAVAEATRARDRADRAQDRAEEAPRDDAEAQTEARTSAEVADRAEHAANDRAGTITRRLEARKERNRVITAIRRAAYDQAFADMGIRITDLAGGGQQRPLTALDLQDTPETNQPLPDEDDALPGPPDDEIIAAGSTDAIRSPTQVLEDRHAAPQSMPQKWRRFPLTLGSFRIDPTDAASCRAASDAFAVRVTEAAHRAIQDWIGTPEGAASAYRPGERILPSNFASEQSWQRTLRDLAARRPASVADLLPDLAGLTLAIEADPDYVDQTRTNLRIAIENGTSLPPRNAFYEVEPSIFQVSLEVTLAATMHKRLRLDRVQPSYRFADWLDYPAMGLNCGIDQLPSPPDIVVLRTTWAPRYIQPRIEPRAIAGVPTSYAHLTDPNGNPADLTALPDAYDAWIATQANVDAGARLPAQSADQERRQHTADIAAYHRESGYIRQGIRLLVDSKAAADRLASAPRDEHARLKRLAAPWQAWLMTNETFARYGQGRFTEWRLFQLAFMLAHLPTLASRMPEFADRFDPDRDELSASLLYFPTGGGKSEAFFGLLIFNLFLDRLRGKHRGITALVRYPLRLLTLQQARRLMRILTRAELVRLHHRIPGAPFEIGFWVGSGNTPNRAAQGFGGVPPITSAAHPDDNVLLNPIAGMTQAARRAQRRSQRYREALESFDKLRVCPCCGQPTGMRKYTDQFNRIGIVCFNPACDWNAAHPGPTRTPLPFILTDDTIYQRAPSVILGTIDKLALIGQHDRTINAIVGMLGVARYMDPDSRHLQMPRGERGLAHAEDSGWTRLAPAYRNGANIFHDPFPSLVIQDEGHLLDESLGTFSGLFETLFETIQFRLGTTILSGQVASWQPDPTSPARRPRLAKVIAATATISDPDRQLKILYQREPLRFPCPGPTLYESFFAIPRQPTQPDRYAFAQSLAPEQRPERASPWMRVYVTVMTNGRAHTMTTSAVVSAYHLALTRLWQLLVQGRPADVIDTVTRALNPSDPLTPLRARALQQLRAAPDCEPILATLLDLQRISLTYVTNKKGGDQIIETLNGQVERDQLADGIAELPFLTELISGGVTIAEIQDVMQKAEGSTRPGQPLPDLGTHLRNIVATSAISHGVDVDKFNAMFFAGLPADIAEYIQASSRVGRTHVGFSLLIPTPQSRRDRYVVETHDQFHRFLERMIPPPAVQRWAERALRRIMPSLLQAYLCGVVEQQAFAAAPDDNKARARYFTTPSAIKTWAERDLGGYPDAIRAVTTFALEAVGIDGRGPNHTGATTASDHYGPFIENRIRAILDLFVARTDASKLSNFWEAKQTPDMRKPMTSLRDIDAAGVIKAAARDPWRGRNINFETTRQIMRIIRGQRQSSRNGLDIRSDVDAEPAPLDAED